MAFSEMEVRELGRNTQNDTHNITSLIRTPQVFSGISQAEEAFAVEEYKHTDTQTHRHTDTDTDTHTHTYTV